MFENSTARQLPLEGDQQLSKRQSQELLQDLLLAVQVNLFIGCRAIEVLPSSKSSIIEIFKLNAKVRAHRYAGLLSMIKDALRIALFQIVYERNRTNSSTLQVLVHTHTVASFSLRWFNVLCTVPVSLVYKT